MPTATDELRDRMHELLGNRIDYCAPMDFLTSRGFVLAPTWTRWSKPNAEHIVTKDEADCIEFLVQEWDFGGLE